MDLCKDDSPVAVTQQKPFSIEQKPRPVLVTSEKNNAVSTNSKPRTREIMSRYKSGLTSTPRSPSPIVSQTSATSRASVPQRAQSAERRRPSTPSSPSLRNSAPSSPKSRHSPPSTPLFKSSTPSSPSSRPSTPLSPSSRSTTPVRDSMVERVNSSRQSLVGRAPDGLWPSIRSLSSSFQSDSPSVLASKSDRPVASKSNIPVASKSDRPVRNPSPDRTLKSSPNVASEMKRTPLRGRNTSDQSENSRPVENSHVRAIDQLRWPGMIGGKVSSNALSTKSMDLTDKIHRSASLSIAARGFSPSRGLPLTDAASRGLKNSTNEAERPVSSKGNEKAALVVSSARNITSLPLERAPSSTRQSRSPSPVPALVRPSSPSKASAALSSISRGMLSPLRTRPSTPSSPSRTRPSTPLSPSRTRPSSPCSSSSNTSTRTSVSSSILNYFADVQKGKRSPTHTEESHQLRLLYNRDLQWHFVNARADVAFSIQTLISEDMLYNVWNITSALRDSLIGKRIDVENLRQEMKLKLILEEQIAYLENWSALEAEHSTSLSGTIEALKASTVRLPVTGRARADVRAVKNAISSAVDVMQAMGSSIFHLLSRVEGTNSLVSELSGVAATESIMLDECRELLASTAAMQCLNVSYCCYPSVTEVSARALSSSVCLIPKKCARPQVQECSLRTHLLQLRQDVQVE